MELEELLEDWIRDKARQPQDTSLAEAGLTEVLEPRAAVHSLGLKVPPGLRPKHIAVALSKAGPDVITTQTSHEAEDFHLCTRCGQRRGTCDVDLENLLREPPPCRICGETIKTDGTFHGCICVSCGGCFHVRSFQYDTFATDDGSTRRRRRRELQRGQLVLIPVPVGCRTHQGR